MVKADHRREAIRRHGIVLDLRSVFLDDSLRSFAKVPARGRQPAGNRQSHTTPIAPMI
jgi:hypothetical protein